MHYYTYAYLREDKTPYYIGKGKGNRIYDKRKTTKPPKDKSRIIYLKQNLTEEEAFKHEIYMISIFGRKDLGTGILHNRTDGGEGASGVLQSEKTNLKRSNALKNLSEEIRRKISEAARKGENHPMYGRTHSEESRRNMSDAHKGKTFSEEHKRKIIEGLKGRHVSEDTRRKISEANKGKTHSEKSKRKMSEARKGKTHSEETKRKMSTSSKGKKCWNDGCGNIKYMIECPGDGWKPGRK
jgi:hypothetical protein